jgi:hypothetical protein
MLARTNVEPSSSLFGFPASSPNCTLSFSTQGFVFGSNIRTTLSIAWSCLSVIILCTWNIIHLNVPAYRPPPKNLRQKLWHSLSGPATQLKWALLAALAPEYLVGKAMGEWRAARFATAGWRRWQWTMTHAYMANMGYFVLDWGELRFKTPARGQPEDAETSAKARVTRVERAREHPKQVPMPAVRRATRAQRREHYANGQPSAYDLASPRSTQATRVSSVSSSCKRHLELLSAAAIAAPPSASSDHADTVVPALDGAGPYDADIDELRGNPLLSVSAKINLSHLKGRRWRLTAAQWYVVAEIHGALPIASITPPLEEVELEDRANVLSKILAVFQIIYLIAQLIARAIYQLPSSQLEIATLAFACCSLITYSLYWQCPQNVMMMRVCKAQRLIYDRELFLTDIAGAGPSYLWLYRRQADQEDSRRDILRPAAIPNDASPISADFPFNQLLGRNNELMSLAIGALVGGSLFGGVHALAWNFEFPSAVEGALWRISSVLTAVLPLISMLPVAFWMRMNPTREKAGGSPVARRLLPAIALCLCLVPYVLARLFLVVETARTLVHLPEGAYTDTWADLLPNWS